MFFLKSTLFFSDAPRLCSILEKKVCRNPRRSALSGSILVKIEQKTSQNPNFRIFSALKNGFICSLGWQRMWMYWFYQRRTLKKPRVWGRKAERQSTSCCYFSFWDNTVVKWHFMRPPPKRLGIWGGGRLFFQTDLWCIQLKVALETMETKSIL